MKHIPRLSLFLSVLLVLSYLHCSAHEDQPWAEQLYFFGESTTVHLRSRGMISAEHVWANDSGTAMLSDKLTSLPLRIGHDLLTPSDAAERLQPRVLVLSFGLNGILYFSDHPEVYLKEYRHLIQALSEASPSTHFLIQTVYPVARRELQKDWHFSVDSAEINRRIRLINQQLPFLCEEDGRISLIDTAACLCDAQGYLKDEFTTDGIHLNEAAYQAILGCFSRYFAAFS